MSRPLNAEERRLLTLARSQQAEIVDDSVAGAWHVILEAIANAWLTPSGARSLQHLLVELRGGGSVSVEEYSLEVEREVGREVGGAGTIVVSHLADRFYVSGEELLFELHRLQARLQGEAEPAPPPRSGQAPPPAPVVAAAPASLTLVPPLPRDEDEPEDEVAAGAAGAPPPGGPSSPSNELGRMIDSLAEKLRSGSADQPGSFLAHLREAMERARAETQQKAAAAAAAAAADPQDELSASAAEAKASVEKLLQSARDIDRGQLAEALHHAAEWVKSPERGGAAIDSLLQRLEARLGEAFRKKDGEPDRVSQALQNARDAMARRIADAAAQKAREASAEGSAAAKAARPRLTSVDDDEKN